MQKISRGDGFGGVLKYCAKGGRLIGGNMAGTTPQELASEFKLSRRQRGCKKPVWHSSLRLPKGETLPEEKWLEIAEAYIKKMGFEPDHQYCVFLHDDEDGQHIHNVASRVSLSGKLFYGQNENLISTKIIHELEREFGLTVTISADDAPPKKRKTPKKGETEKALRTLVKPARVVLADLVDSVLQTERPKTPEDLKNALSQKGVEVEFFEKGGEIKGITFHQGGLKFSGSALGDDYKFPRLLERMKYDAAIKTQNHSNPSNPKRDEPGHPDTSRPEPENPRIRKKGLVAREGRRATETENRNFQTVLKGDNMENQKQIGGLTYRKRTPAPTDPTNLDHGWTEFCDRSGKVWFYPDDEAPRPGNLSGYSWQPHTQDRPAAVCAYDTAINKHGLEQAARDVVRIAVFKGLPEPISTHGTDDFRRAVAQEMFRLNIELADQDGPAKQEFDRLHKARHEESEKARLAQVNSISAAFRGIDDQAAASHRAALARAAQEQEDTPAKKDSDRMRGPRQ